MTVTDINANATEHSVRIVAEIEQAATLGDTLLRMVEGFKAEAVSLEGCSKRGATGRQKDLRSAAAVVAALMIRVNGRVPAPIREPVERIELPGPVIAGSFGPGDVPVRLLPQSETDAAIEAAFPLPTVVSYLEPAAAFNMAAVAEELQTALGTLPTLPGNYEATSRHAAAAFAGEPGPPIDLLNIPTMSEAPEMQLTLNDPARPKPYPNRMTFAAVRELWDGLPQSGGLSYSKITDAENCGMKALLSRSARHGLIAPGRPQWALIAGRILHAVIEDIERTMHAGDLAAAPPSTTELQEAWPVMFSASVAAEEQALKTPHAEWRASKQGLENYDWWRVEGERMLKMYLDTNMRADLREKTGIVSLSVPEQPDMPALELPIISDIEGVPFKLVIDQVWSGPQFAIRDLKFGADDGDTFQLGIYEHLLARAWGMPTSSFVSAFWLGRKGINSTQVSAATLHPWDEVVYRTHEVARQEAARVATPRVSSFCHGCEFKAVCPAGPKS